MGNINRMVHGEIIEAVEVWCIEKRGLVLRKKIKVP